ncbi:MAG: hypothetical protein IMZ58_02195, partial [Thermoplasmata archaeon]|nr:hypothetical protein [Thermoplasmata archaeon]
CAPGFTPSTPNPPPPTPPLPCAGNTAPSISSVLLDSATVSIGEPVHVVVGTPYVVTINASDPDGILGSLTYSATIDETPVGTVASNVITVIPLVVGTFEIYVNVNDGCTSTPWGPVTVVVCPPLNEALVITKSDETPCYGTCLAISKISVSYTDGVTPNLEIVPTYIGKNLTWEVDPGITFNPVEGTVCLDESNNGQVGVNYNIKFTYTDECSGTATATGTATINFGGPTAEANGPYTGDAICGSTAPNIHLVSTGSIKGDGVNVFEWFDGAISLGTGETLDLYLAPDSYTITLEVTDANGCTDSDDASVVINAVAGPTAEANGPYTGDAICGSTAPNIHLVSTGSIKGDGVNVFEWFDGAISLGTGETLDLYLAPDSYTITLEVTDANGCTDSDDASVDVNVLPAFESFTLSTDSLVCCVGLPGTFDITATYSDGDKTLYLDSTGVTYTVTGGVIVSNESTNTITATADGTIQVCYEDSGPCGTVEVCATTINITVDEDEFFIMDNKGTTYGLDINDTDLYIEVPNNANHIFFGVSACIDPDTIIEFKYDRSHCGGGVSEYIRAYGGIVDPTMINLCNGDSTFLWIRIGGVDGAEYEFEIYRL